MFAYRMNGLSVRRPKNLGFRWKASVIDNASLNEMLVSAEPVNVDLWSSVQ